MAERPHLPVLRNSRHAVVVVVVEAVGKWATAALSQLSTCPQPGLHQHLKEPKGHQRIYRMKLALSLFVLQGNTVLLRARPASFTNALRGLHKEVWEGEDIGQWLAGEREAWD